MLQDSTLSVAAEYDKERARYEYNQFQLGFIQQVIALSADLHGSNLVRTSPAKYLQTGDWKVPQGFQSFTLTISFLALTLTRSFIRHLLWLSSAGVPVGLDTTKPKMCIVAPTETFP